MSLTRLQMVQAGLAGLEIDALVVSNPTNIRYLVGFTGSNGALLLRSETVSLFTDTRYREQAADEPMDHLGAEIVTATFGGDGLRQTGNAIPSGVERVGLEAEHLTWAQATALEQDAASVSYVPITGYIETFRQRKDALEIETMRRAARISDTAITGTIDAGIAGRSERDVAAMLDQRVRELGGHDVAFETIVASGPHSARPHHRPSPRVVEQGDLVVIDSGTMIDGYRSDMTRSFIVGEPNQQQTELLEAVEQAQAAGVALARPGVAVGDIDRACREVLEARGLGDAFVHGTGHGVGLDIHEAPWVNAKSTAILDVGHVITVEPGAYLEGIGGVRWEDTLLITETGAEALTHAPKQPYL